MRKAHWYGLICVLLGAGAVWADGDENEGRGNGPADRVFEAELLRVAELGSPQPLGAMFTLNGTDPLRGGSVAVNRQREVEVQVQGAVASATYAAFCGGQRVGPVSHPRLAADLGRRVRAHTQYGQSVCERVSNPASGAATGRRGSGTARPDRQGEHPGWGLDPVPEDRRAGRVAGRG